MQHLVNAIEEAGKDYGLSLSRSFLVDLLNYLGTGDEKLLLRLRKVKAEHLPCLDGVARALPRPDRYEEPDRRLLRFLADRSPTLRGQPKAISIWITGDNLLATALAEHLQQEKPAENFCASLSAVVLASGISQRHWLRLVARHLKPHIVEKRLTSTGRYLATRPAPELVEVLSELHCYVYNDTHYFALFAAEEPAALEALMDEVIRLKKVNDVPFRGWEAALDKNPTRFETRVAAAFRSMRSRPARDDKSKLGRCLEKHFPGKYLEEAIAAASNIGGESGSEEQVGVVRWLSEKQGVAALPAIKSYIANWNLHNRHIVDWKVAVLKEAVTALGRETKPALIAAMQPDVPELRRGALELWINLRDSVDDTAIQEQLFKELSAQDAKELVQFIPLAASWNVVRSASKLWPLLEHKSKPVREATGHALSKLGDAGVESAVERLSARKADVRQGAVTTLAAIGTERAAQALKSHLAREISGDVQDLIKRSLSMIQSQKLNDGASEKTQPTKALKPDQQQVEATIASAAPKIKKAPADWLQETKLPPLFFDNGKQLGPDAVRYLLYRQSREKEIAAEPEAALVYALIDRKRSGDFALFVLQGYLDSTLEAKDRWALAVAGMLGDDRIVPILTRRIAEWAEASRGKLAEYAVQALALLASDAALLAVDAMAIRYRTKFKNIGKAATLAFAAAADARGLSPAELGDKVLPWLGFEPGKPRVLEFGGNRVEVALGLDFKLAWRDLVKGKPIKALPASAPDEVKAQIKELSAGLKEAVKAQLLRMENLMVQQHRWPAARWAELFLQHPLVFPFAVRLVWGLFDQAGKVQATWRALEDHTLTDATDESCALPSVGNVGIVHPLELPQEAREAWLKHQADYEIEPPFPQLERPVVTVKPAERELKFAKAVDGLEINAMTFKGRAERLGWSRGSVCDAGGITSYFKPFPAAGVDVFLTLEGMYIGIDMYSDITLGQVFFAKHGAVKIGSYEYDEPSKESDPRVLGFGDVPAIAFSEAMGDLARISGKAAVGAAEQPEKD